MRGKIIVVYAVQSLALFGTIQNRNGKSTASSVAPAGTAKRRRWNDIKEMPVLKVRQKILKDGRDDAPCGNSSL